MHIQETKAFTLVELIVVITILAILATIGYISLLGYAGMARDTTRLSDIGNITKVIELTKLSSGSFPQVTNPVDITFSGSVIWTMGSFGQDSHIDAQRLSEVPKDPLTGSEYTYSTTSQTGEFQVGGILERLVTSYSPMFTTTYAEENVFSFASSKIKGNYNGKFITYTETISPSSKKIYILGAPSILLSDTSQLTLEQIHAADAFVYEGEQTAPYTYSGSVSGNSSWNPGLTLTDTGNIAVVYEGTTDDLSTAQGKVALVKNIQDYYQGTAIERSNDFKGLSDIDAVNETDKAISLVNTYIGVGVGGLHKEITGITDSDINEEVNFFCIDSTEVNTLNSELGFSYTAEQWCIQTSLNVSNKTTLTQLPAAFSKLTGIVNLTMSNNPNLTTLGANISNLTNLTNLNLSNNSTWTTLPTGVDTITSLQGLTMSNNPNLTTLGANISNLTNLTSLNLSNNSTWTTLPTGVDTITSLQGLTMSNNDSLTDLGVNIGNLVNLTSINFSNNSWVNLPTNMENIPGIQGLTLSNNTNLGSLNSGYNSSSSQVCESLSAGNTCIEGNGTRVVVTITP